MELNLDSGSIVDQRFQVIEQIGMGGMGSVYRAKQLGLEREVAIKILQTQLLEDNEFKQRFEREAIALSQLTHKHIGAFYSYGVWNEKLPYIVMEFLSGKALNEVLKKEGPLDWRRTCPIITQICDAMQYAHDGGIVHRDLKPSNITLQDNDYVKVLDFGLSKLSTSVNKDKLTKTGFLIGSIDYMSPEQCAGRAADNKSDIYSLGCIFYECLTGHPPHEADTPIGLLHKHSNEDVLPPSEKLGRKLPAGLDEVFIKALAKNPGDRYQSMAEMRKDIDEIIAGTGSKIRLPDNIQKKRKKHGSNPKLVLLGLSCILLAGIGISALDAMKHNNRVRNLSAIKGILETRQRMPAKQATELLDDALEYFRVGQLDKSMEKIEFVLSKKIDAPQELRALQYHAIVDTRRNDQRQALKYWKKALDFCELQMPGNPSEWRSISIDTRTNYINSLLQNNDLQEAEKSLNKLEADCRLLMGNRQVQSSLLHAKTGVFLAKGDQKDLMHFCSKFAKTHAYDSIGLKALFLAMLHAPTRPLNMEKRSEFLKYLQRMPDTETASEALQRVGESLSYDDALDVLRQAKLIQQKKDMWSLQDECTLLSVELKPHTIFGETLASAQVEKLSAELIKQVSAAQSGEFNLHTPSATVIAELSRLKLENYGGKAKGKAKVIKFLDEISQLLSENASKVHEQLSYIAIERALLDPVSATKEVTENLEAISTDQSLPLTIRSLSTYALGNIALQDHKDALALKSFQKGVDLLSPDTSAVSERSLLLRSKGTALETAGDLAGAEQCYIASFKENMLARPAGADPQKWKERTLRQLKESFTSTHGHDGLLKRLKEL